MVRSCVADAGGGGDGGGILVVIVLVRVLVLTRLRFDGGGEMSLFMMAVANDPVTFKQRGRALPREWRQWNLPMDGWILFPHMY